LTNNSPRVYSMWVRKRKIAFSGQLISPFLMISASLLVRPGTWWEGHAFRRFMSGNGGREGE
jgi:hypothetical protein